MPSGNVQCTYTCVQFCIYKQMHKYVYINTYEYVFTFLFSWTIQERNILAIIHSPYVVCLKYAFATPTDLYLILDLMTGMYTYVCSIFMLIYVHMCLCMYIDICMLEIRICYSHGSLFNPWSHDRYVNLKRFICICIDMFVVCLCWYVYICVYV
jgi:hypothetical protein